MYIIVTADLASGTCLCSLSWTGGNGCLDELEDGGLLTVQWLIWFVIVQNGYFGMADTLS